MNLIDVTHTVKASAAPSPGARYMLDPATEERFWVEVETVPVPVPTVSKSRRKNHKGEGDA